MITLFILSYLSSMCHTCCGHFVPIGYKLWVIVNNKESTNVEWMEEEINRCLLYSSHQFLNPLKPGLCIICYSTQQNIFQIFGNQWLFLIELPPLFYSWRRNWVQCCFLVPYNRYIVSNFSMCVAGLRTGVPFHLVLQLYI